MKTRAFLTGITTSFFSPFVFANNSITFKQNNVLSVCSYTAFTPVIYGNGEGYEADLLKAIAKALNVNIKFYPEKIYEGLWQKPSKDNAICDVSAGGFSPLEERKKQGGVFSDGSVYFAQSLLVRRSDYESGKITGYASFKNTSMKVGMVPATSGETFYEIRAQENGLKEINKILLPDEDKLLEALANGQIDALARGELGNEYQASLDARFVTIDKKSFGESLTYSIDPNNKRLQEAMNQLIHKLTQNVTYVDWMKDHNVFMFQLPKPRTALQP